MRFLHTHNPKQYISITVNCNVTKAKTLPWILSLRPNASSLATNLFKYTGGLKIIASMVVIYLLNHFNY